MIYTLIQQCKLIRQIAKMSGRAVITILKDKRRRTTTQIRPDLTTYEKYFPETGCEVYKKNRKNCGAKFKIA